MHSIGQDKRADIISRARKLRAEIAQTFADAAHWNSINVPHKGPAIDPDPDGELRRIADGLDKMLAGEKKLTRDQIALVATYAPEGVTTDEVAEIVEKVEQLHRIGGA